MARKEDIIARLNELSSVLDREIDTTGSVADLELRLREVEDEVAALADDTTEAGTGGPDGSGSEGDTAKGDAAIQADAAAAGDSLISIRVNKTLHIQVAHGKGLRTKIIPQGTEVTVRASEFSAFRHLATRVK